MGAFLPTPAPLRCRGRRRGCHGKHSPSLLWVWAQAAQHLAAATQYSPASPPPASRYISPTVRLREVGGKQRASGAGKQWDPWLPSALSQHPLVRSVVLWGAGGTDGGAAGDIGGWQGSLTVCSTTRSGSESTSWLPPRRTPRSGACRGPEPQSCPGCRSVPTCGGQKWHEAVHGELLTSSELSLLHPSTKGTSPVSTTDPSVLPLLSSSPC